MLKDYINIKLLKMTLEKANLHEFNLKLSHYLKEIIRINYN